MLPCARKQLSCPARRCFSSSEEGKSDSSARCPGTRTTPKALEIGVTQGVGDIMGDIP